MSRDIQLAHFTGLPVAADDAWQQSTALGPPMGGPGGGGMPEAPLKKVHRLMRGRYILAFVLAFVGAGIGAFIGYKSKQPLYQSTGYIQIMPYSVDALTNRPEVTPYYTQYVQTQCAMLTHQRVLSAAMESEKWRALGRPLDDAAFSEFGRSVSVGPGKGTFYILVSFLDKDPRAAQIGAEAVIRAYWDIYSSVQQQERAQRLDRLERDANARTLEIRRHRDKIRNIGGDDGENLDSLHKFMLESTFQLRKAHFDARMEREAAEAVLAVLEGEKDVDKNKAAEMTPEQIAQYDPMMREYLRFKEKADRDLKTLQRTYGPNHPNIQDKKAEVEQYDEEIKTLVTNFRTRFQALQVGPNGQIQAPITEDLIKELKAKEERLVQLFNEEREKSNEVGRRMSEIKSHNDQIADLKSEFDKINKALESEKADAMLVDRTTIMNYGDKPLGPAVDDRKKFAMLGFMGGGAIPVAILLLIGMLDRRYRYSEEAGTEMSGITLLGILPNLPDLLTDPEQAAIAAHCVHQIRTMLQINGQAMDRRVFAVTSASAGDGKTSLTLALGLSFAASGSRTLLIDCDLVGAGLTSRMNMASNEGVLEAIVNRNLLEYVRPTDVQDLAMLPVGSAQAHHASMLSPTALRRLVAEAKKHYETILIDTGPILGSIEASSVCSAADGVILTVARGQQRPLVEKSLAHLASIGARLAGVVFNRAQARDFERSVSRISMRSVPQRPAAAPTTSGNGHDITRSGSPNRLGPVARAVASSVKPEGEDDAANGQNGHG